MIEALHVNRLLQSERSHGETQNCNHEVQAIIPEGAQAPC